MKTTLKLALIVLALGLTACANPKQAYNNLPPQIQALHNYIEIINKAAYEQNDPKAAFVLLSCDVSPGKNLNIYGLSDLREKDKEVFLSCWRMLKEYPLHNPSLQQIDFTVRGGHNKIVGNKYHIITNLNKCLAYFDIIYELEQ